MAANVRAANIKTGNFNKKNLADGDPYKAAGNSYKAAGNSYKAAGNRYKAAGNPYKANGNPYKAAGNIYKADGDHYNLEWLYVLSVISSIILGGFAESLNKCDTHKGNNPLCIPPEEVIHRRLKGGGGTLDPINKYLDMAMNASTPSGDMSALGKFMNLVQMINNKFLTIFENTSKVLLGVKTAANNPQMKEEIIAFLDENKELIKKMTRDEEVQAALREWVEEMGVLNIQLMDMAKPIIDRLSSEIVASINEAAVKATQGIISTSFNVVEAGIGEIPVAGGIFDVVLDFMRGFNSAMQAAGPIVEFSTEAFFRALRTIFTTFAIVNEKSSDIQRAVYRVEGALKSISIENLEEQGRQAGKDYLNSVLPQVKLPEVKLPEVTKGPEVKLPKATEPEDTSTSAEEEKESDASKGGGQVKKKRANIQKRIKHVTHRLRKTIRKFMRKTKKYRL